MAEAERARLLEVPQGRAPWRRWGPYLSERSWGTVREDYSATGDAWRYLPHDHARSRAYRRNEDGLAGLCDDQQWLCFATFLDDTDGRRPAFGTAEKLQHDPALHDRLFFNEYFHGD